MGTEIIAEKDCYVKRIYGGSEKGVCFVLDIDQKRFSQKELLDFISRILKNTIVSGEGKEGSE